MKTIKNICIQGKHGKPILTDIFYNENSTPKPVIIFAHGYKGYKDWGCWNLVAESFAEENIFFVKFNFSHNGGTVEQPIDFPDLEAFGENNFVKELDDLQYVIDWFYTNDSFKKEVDLSRITLIGHSRGGGIVTLKANEDKRISKVITWSGVSDFESRFPKGEILQKWQENGVSYIENSRTKQQMPHYFQFYENFLLNKDRLHIQTAVQQLKIPYLIIHGSADETVSIHEAKSLHSWNPNNQFLGIENANHAFGAKHPWDENTLPKHLLQVVQKSIVFVKNL